ncbi:MAG: prenyltransferase [Mycoplasmatales bacterium]
MNYFQRIYTILELRTAVTAALCALVGSMFGAYINDSVNILLMVLIVLASYFGNLIANVANEIGGYYNGEDTNHTIDDHHGNNGIVRGIVSLKEAYFILIVIVGITGFLGMSIVFITQDLFILLAGGLAAIVAIFYSLGPLPFFKIPIGEILSGVFCGGITCLVGIYIQTGHIEIGYIIFATILVINVSFLMAVNNTSDYYKDLETRVTLPHVIGFVNSIKLIKYELFLVLLLWSGLLILGYLNFIIYLIGLFIIIFFGIIKFYTPYSKIKKPYKEMKGICIFYPLKYNIIFCIVMSFVFLMFS